MLTSLLTSEPEKHDTDLMANEPEWKPIAWRYETATLLAEVWETVHGTVLWRIRDRAGRVVAEGGAEDMPAAQLRVARDLERCLTGDLRVTPIR